MTPEFSNFRVSPSSINTSTQTTRLSTKSPRRRSTKSKSLMMRGSATHANLNERNLSKISYILSQLSHDELETAARASYEYLKAPFPPQRNHYARRIVQRYLDSKKGKVDLALEKVKKTLKFRRDMKIDDLITAFDHCNENDGADMPETAVQLEKHLSNKQYFVQGRDNEGRSTLFFIPRLVNGHDNEWTIKEAIYSIERAIACSRAKDQTINAVVDFSGFSMTKHSPPVEIGKQFLTTLRSHYAGQIHHIYLTDTPFSFSLLWNVFYPFVGTSTREKIKFINGARTKERELLQIYDAEEVPAWLISGGKNNRPLDVNEYLHELSFDQTFNEQIL